MHKKDLSFLSELVEAPSPSGFEQPAAKVFRTRLAKTADTRRDQRHGLGPRRAQGLQARRRVGHARRSHRRDRPDGQLHHAGGLHRLLGDRRRGRGDPAGHARSRAHQQGHAARRDGSQADPPHRGRRAQERHQTREALHRRGAGAPTKVKKQVRIGDPITFDVGLETFGDDLAVSRAFDDKMGAWISARVLEEVKKAGGAAGDLIAAATVQEEVGLRGGITSAYGVDPAGRHRGRGRPRDRLSRHRQAQARRGELRRRPHHRSRTQHQPGAVRAARQGRREGEGALPDRRRAARDRHRRQRHPALARRQGRRAHLDSRCATCTRRQRCSRSRTSTRPSSCSRASCST